MSVDSGQATWTLAALAALDEADPARLGAFAGVRPEVVASILRVDADLVDETIVTEGRERRTTWRLRDREKLRLRMGQMGGRGTDAAQPDGAAGIMPSDVAVAEQACLRAYAIAQRPTRGVLARTALHLIGRLQPHVHVKNWRARLALMASVTPVADSVAEPPDGVAADSPGALGRRAALVVVSATVLQAMAAGDELGVAELDNALRIVSAHRDLDQQPLYRALLDALGQSALRSTGTGPQRADLVARIQALSAAPARGGAPIADTAPSANPPRREHLELLQEYISTPTWAESQRLVEQHPWLLSQEAEATIQHMLKVLLDRGELAMAREFERQVGPLRHAPHIGVAAAFAEMASDDGRQSVVMAFIEASTWAESREILRRHPELLDDLVLSGVAFLVDRAGEGKDLAAVDYFAAHLDLLRRSREVGADAAFAERVGHDSGPAKSGMATSDPIARAIFAELVDSTVAASAAESMSAAKPDHRRLASLARTMSALLAAQTWEESGRLLVAHGELLDEEVIHALDSLAAVTERDDPALAATLREHWRILREVRAAGPSGAAAAFAAATATAGASAPRAGRDVRATVFEFLQAGTEAQMRAYAARHPVLLEPEADAVLASLARDANAEGHGNLALQLAECRRMLDQVRSGAATEPEDDRSAAASGGQPSLIPMEVAPLLNRIMRLTGDDEMLERADLLRRVVAAIDPKAYPDLWVSMQSMLGATLGDIVERDDSLDFDEAIAALEASLPVLAGMPDATRMLAVNQHNLGKFYAHRRTRPSSGHIDLAIEHFHVALGYGDQLPAQLTTDALRELAALYLDRKGADRAQDIEEAIACADRALTLIDRAAFPLEWAAVSDLLGSAYTLRLGGVRRENLAKAIKHLHAAEAMVDRETSPSGWVAIQLGLGSAYREGAIEPPAETMERAIGHFQAAADVARRLSVRRQAEAFNGLGTAYMDRVLGDPADNVETAIGYYRQARKICRAAAMDYEDAVAARNLAVAYLKRDNGMVDENVDTAIKLLDEAMAEFTEDDTPYDRAMALMTLGHAYLGRGREGRASNIEKAVEAIAGAAGIFRRIEAPREEALCRINLANAHLSAAGYDPARVLTAVGSLELALAEFRRQGLVVEQARTLDALGQAWARWDAGDRSAVMDRAIGYHNEAIQTLGSPIAAPEMWVMIKSNLGAAHLERGSSGRARDRELELAIACLEDALAVGAGRQLGLTGGLAMTRVNLGIAYTQRAAEERERSDDLATAIAHLERGFETVTAVGVPLHRLIAGKALGEAYSRTGHRWTEAAHAYRQALAAADSLYVSALLRSDREAELTAASDLQRSAAYAAAMAGDPEQAVVWLERGRARSLGDALARDQAELERIASVHPRLADEFQQAAGEVQKSEAAEWAAATGALGDPAGSAWQSAPADESLRRRRMRQARERLDRAVEAIRALTEHSGFLRQPELADIISVAATMGPIAYLATSQLGCLALLVAADRDGGPPTVRRLPAPEIQFTSAALRAMLIRSDDARPHRGYLREQVEPGSSALANALDELLPILGRELMRPVADAVEECGARGVTIVACGLLGLLPLHAANFERNGVRRTLLDELVVGYAPSARVLDAARSRRDRRATARAHVLAGVGNPAGGRPLPNAAFETREIARLFEWQHTFYEAEATKAELVNAASAATHIHLACHGTFAPNHPLESGLSLAGDGRADPLTLREILTERPFREARMVVASACRTAVSDFAHLPDEVMGLPSGLLQAGTPGVIGTLWPVEDLSTALLMIRFYEELVGAQGPETDRPAVALRSAQRWLARSTAAELDAFIAVHDRGRRAEDLRPARDISTTNVHPGVIPRRNAGSADERPFAHPYFWAPFVFIGA